MGGGGFHFHDPCCPGSTYPPMPMSFGVPNSTPPPPCLQHLTVVHENVYIASSFVEECNQTFPSILPQLWSFITMASIANSSPLPSLVNGISGLQNVNGVLFPKPIYFNAAFISYTGVIMVPSWGLALPNVPWGLIT